MAGSGAFGRAAGIFKSTGLDKVLGLGAVGILGGEAYKYGVANPLLERAGIKPPSYTPPPAISAYEQVLLGQQQTPGFFGIGGQQRTEGLIERRANQNLELERAERLSSIDQRKNAQVQAYRLAEMQLNNNSPLALTQTLADRDRYSSQQNALANISASISNGRSGTQSSVIPMGYSNTGYAQQQPMPNYSQLANPSSMNYAAGQYMGKRGRVGRNNRYGLDTNLTSSDMGGLPITPEVRGAYQISPEQYGQFSGRNGAIARQFESAKYGVVDNRVPGGAEQYAMGFATGEYGGGYGAGGYGRRRGMRG